MDIVGKPSKHKKPITSVKINFANKSIRLSRALLDAIGKYKIGFAYDTSNTKIFLVFLEDGLKLNKNRGLQSNYHTNRIGHILGETEQEFYIDVLSPEKVSDDVEGYLLVPLTKELRMKIIDDSYDESSDWMQ